MILLEMARQARRLTTRLDAFTRSYVETALWSSLGDADVPLPLERDFGVEDVADDTLAQMIRDCEAFQEAEADDLRDSGLSDERAGMNFWLTRTRQGSGFWDEGLGAIGDRLTKAAHAYGSVDLYVGDDDKVHAV